MPEDRVLIRRVKRIVPYVLAAIAVAAFCALVVFAVRWDSANQRRDREGEAQTLVEVNRICGSAPVSVKRHGTGWSNGPFWEVRCQDGTIRVVSER